MENHPAVKHPLSPAASETDDQDILNNIDGRMHGPMSGFQTTGRVSGRLSVPSAAPSPDGFLQWFSDYARGMPHISRGNVAPEHESDDDDARLLLAMPTSPASNGQTIWDHVQVFANQPTRLFLHGFYIRGSLIELWVFDRSGLYCSELFDVQKDFIQFLSIILSYQRMTDHYCVLGGVVMPSLGKLYLESQPTASREKLVGTGTTCHRTRLPDSSRWNSVLKFKWRWARERPEDELLKLAKKKSVWGAISLDHYKEVESTANLRRSLRNGSIEEQRQEVTCSADGLVEYGRNRQLLSKSVNAILIRYRHELGSFLYVFLWTIITNRTDNSPETSKLRQWSNGDWEELAVLL
ncbi:hypothetical protein F4804DRAFT_342923 [Jackrogersella minutella]|nr:hypothetical protein F4804DRAFT_342923 [Jackrogersella minutella]